jgi:hypothetical protein
MIANPDEGRTATGGKPFATIRLNDRVVVGMVAPVDRMANPLAGASVRETSVVCVQGGLLAVDFLARGGILKKRRPMVWAVDLWGLTPARAAPM